MKFIASILLVLSVAGFAGQSVAQTADETDPNTKQYLEQLDRETRGGQGQ
jgi:hypothetical protein